jgi:hypothetical protein
MKARTAAGSALALALLVSACGGGSENGARAPRETAPPKAAPSTTTGAPSRPTTAPTTSPPPSNATATTEATAPPTRFPAVVNEVMETVAPRPPGLEAPATLPATAGAISAETSGLGGTYSVTLIATAKPVPVNSPELAAAAANPASDLGTFSTTPTSSLAAAAAYLRTSSGQYISACAGAAASIRLPGTLARGCATAEGEALTWRDGPWQVQVSLVGGSRPPYGPAEALAAWLGRHQLPVASAGVVSVSVPGAPEAGTTTSSLAIWQAGKDVYQASAPGGVLRALELAASMLPWPSG